MILDFHTHVFPSVFRNDRDAIFPHEPSFELLYSSPRASMVGASELIRTMDKDGVNRSVIFGFPWEEEALFKRHNDYVIESVQLHPGRLTGFCCFSVMAPGAAREAERCLKSGLSGVGELAVYDSGLTPEVTSAFKDVMSVCTEFDVPLLLHVNEPVGHNYPGKAPITLHQIYHFIKTYPSNRIVLAHWGGGIFFFNLLKKEVKDILKNVWFDTAASPYIYSPDVYRIAGEIIGFDKILFGSDYPLLRPKRYFDEMTAAGLAGDALAMMTGLNGEKVLNLKSQMVS